MSSQNPTPAGGPLVEGPHDPEHDPRASYGLEPEYVASLTDRLIATTGRTVVVESPLNGGPLANIPQSSEDDIKEAYARARRAQAAWARTSLEERSQILLRLHDLVLERQDEIIDLICWESGKARKHAFDEPLHIALTARYYARTAHQHLDTQRKIGVVPGAHPGRGQPGAEGRGRHHLALELPLHDGAVRRAPGAARRQRRGRQAGRADHAVRAARRPPARRGRLPQGPVAGRRRSRPRARRPDDRALRLHLLHRLDRHRPADRDAVRRAADRLLAGARWQEPDPGAARRRPGEGGRGRRPRVVLQRRPAVRLDGADVRRRPGLRPVRRAVRGRAPRR